MKPLATLLALGAMLLACKQKLISERHLAIHERSYSYGNKISTLHQPIEKPDSCKSTIDSTGIIQLSKSQVKNYYSISNSAKTGK